MNDLNETVPCPRCVELQHYILQANSCIHWQLVALHHEQLASARLNAMIEAQQHQINQLEVSLARIILETHKVLMSCSGRRAIRGHAAWGTPGRRRSYGT